jgi:hypothetical protein
VSKTAFLTAMHASTIAMAVIVGCAALLIGLWAPGRDGQQLRFVRRILAARSDKNPSAEPAMTLRSD